MAGALNGIRVIDFGQYIAGPLAGMLLADQGADVIKIDPPGGPVWQTPANSTWNRGKRSILLDLKQPDDLATAQSLIETADVVLENFRPGVMERLGLGPEAMTEANPRLVYCSIPGFASDDPRAQMPAYEGIIGAAAATFRPPNSKSDRPVYTAIPIASTYGAFQSVVAIVMALNARQRDGVGQRIEVPLFDSMFQSIGRFGVRVHNAAPAIPTLQELWGGIFHCKDDQWVRFGGSGNQNFRQFVEAAGITSWDAEGLTDHNRPLDDPAFKSEAQRRIAELFRTRTAQEWEDLIAEAGSEGAVCRTSAEWFDHPHARAAQMVVEVDDQVYGKMLQPGINARMSLTPGEVRGPAPTPDQHRQQILAELKAGVPDTSPKSDGQAGAQSVAGTVAGTVDGTMRAALDGIKVLDLCIILAGPTMGRTLSEYGADVIKIDNPKRGGTIARHNDINRGKRSILLDLKSDAGRDVFWRMLEDTDVVAQNYRAGALDKLGLGYEAVRRRKPDIVYASLNAYGHLGPWAGRPGHEGFAQAASGMTRRFGGDGQPESQPNPINDYGTGFMGAYGVALALLHRQRTGQGQHVDSALAYTAMTLQSPFMQMYEGKQWDETRGQDALGSGSLQRAYQASDGWFFLGAQTKDLPRLCQVEGLSGIDELAVEALAPSLEERFLGNTVDAWVRRLTEAGVGAQRVVTNPRELMTDPWVIDHGLSLTREHSDLGPVTTCGPAPRLSRTPVRPGGPATKPGSDVQEVLTEFGMGGDYQRLLDSGVILTEGVTAG
ncbi:MAG: CoA transferase [Chloroflexi bacterium]|nr:CoA transferase [Chloroflexota bacterium]